MKTRSYVELLESRIAPAAIYHFTDVDGDLVTIKTSKGTDAQLAARAGALMPPAVRAPAVDLITDSTLSPPAP